MRSMKELVEIQLGEHTATTTTTPVSFRCADDIVLKMDLLTKYLGFSTRSKLLSELVPIALNDAIGHLPDHMAEKFQEEYDELVHAHTLYEMRPDQSE